MPTDKNGKYHLNEQRKMAAEKGGAGAKPIPKEGMTAEHGSMHEHAGATMGHTTLHDHGDGTFHTEGHDGEHVEHPHIGHALAHMGAKHSGANIEALEQHLGQFFNEEEHEGSEYGGGAPTHEHSAHNSHSLSGL